MAQRREQRHRNVCTTHWGDISPVVYVEEHPETHTKVQYIISGRERCPDTRRWHWQTYIQFKTQMTFNQVKTLFDDDTIHIERQRARHQEDPIQYCKKDGDWLEWGTPKQQGERTDIPSMAEMEEYKTIEELEQVLNPTTYCRMKRAITEMWNNAQDRKIRRIHEEEAKEAELRPWQRWILDNIPESRRKITWIWDDSGNTGKSYLAEHMQLTMNALVTQTTHMQNIAYAYNRHEYVVFDLARAEWDPNYTTIEAFTNRTIFSGKYESTSKPCISKVIVFSNSPPDESKLSRDRWNIINVKDINI